MSAAPAYAATPANLHYSHTAGGPDAALRQLAARTRNATPVRGAGRYHYVHTRGWYLHADADLHNRVQHSGIAAVDRQQWIAADGSGRLKVVSAGKQIMPTGTYAAGGLAPSGIAASASAAQIRKRHHVRPTAASWIAEINEVWSDQVVPPGLQATLLRELASQPHLTLLGTTTDRAGRRGLAVSATSVSGKSRERSVLILDQRTGMLLDAETMALTAGSLPVKAPATTAYTVWLTQGFTNTTQRVP
jgi:hypothetical protein